MQLASLGTTWASQVASDSTQETPECSRRSLGAEAGAGVWAGTNAGKEHQAACLEGCGGEGGGERKRICGRARAGKRRKRATMLVSLYVWCVRTDPYRSGAAQLSPRISKTIPKETKRTPNRTQ